MKNIEPFIRFSFIVLLLSLSTLCSAQKVGLVLSGGGVRGMAHIGVIKALEENNIPIDFIAGTSAGAIVACMYAQGYSGIQMDSIVKTDDFLNWATGVIDEDYSYYFRKKEDNASWISLKFALDSVISTSLPTNIISSIPYDYSLLENTTAVIAKANYNFDSLFIPFFCFQCRQQHNEMECRANRNYNSPWLLRLLYFRVTNNHKE